MISVKIIGCAVEVAKSEKKTDPCSPLAPRARFLCVPVVYASQDNIEVHLKGIKVGNNYIVEVFHPGVKEPVVIQLKTDGDEYILNVPVKRKCAMVHLKKITSLL